MTTHSNILAWRIPGTGEPSGLPSMGSHRVRHDWSDLAAAAACFLRPIWLRIPGCLALSEWSHHCGYLRNEDLLRSSSVYSCQLFLISSASVRSISFLCFIVPIVAWNNPLVYLIFLKAFPILLLSIYFFALITEEGFLISPSYSLELCIQMLIYLPFSFAFCFSSFHSYL